MNFYESKPYFKYNHVYYGVIVEVANKQHRAAGGCEFCQVQRTEDEAACVKKIISIL